MLIIQVKYKASVEINSTSVDAGPTEDGCNHQYQVKTAANPVIEEAPFFLMPGQQNLKHYIHAKDSPSILKPKPSLIKTAIE